MTAVCRWQSAGSYFRCALRIPHRVRTGRSARYMITAYEKVPYAGVVAAPGTPGAANPEIVHFR